MIWCRPYSISSSPGANPTEPCVDYAQLFKTLYIVPVILVISFAWAGILLPESMTSIKGEGAALVALALTILTFRFFNGYYAKREQNVSDQTKSFNGS